MPASAVHEPHRRHETCRAPDAAESVDRLYTLVFQHTEAHSINKSQRGHVTAQEHHIHCEERPEAELFVAPGIKPEGEERRRPPQVAQTEHP